MAAAFAGYLDLNHDHVLVAVGVDILHLLDETGFFTFDPKFVAGAAPVARFAGLDRESEGLFVHEGEHEDFAGFGVGRDARDQAVGIEFRAEDVPEFNVLFSRSGSENRLAHGEEPATSVGKAQNYFPGAG